MVRTDGSDGFGAKFFGQRKDDLLDILLELGSI
jgi:hypothetical protein